MENKREFDIEAAKDQHTKCHIGDGLDWLRTVRWQFDQDTKALEMKDVEIAWCKDIMSAQTDRVEKLKEYEKHYLKAMARIREFELERDNLRTTISWHEIRDQKNQAQVQVMKVALESICYGMEIAPECQCCQHNKSNAVDEAREALATVERAKW